VITWLTFEVPIASVATVGLSSEAFGQLQCPALKWHGYEAGVIGGGQGLDSEGTGEHGTRRSSHSVKRTDPGIVPFLQLIKHFACHVEILKLT
jgi:hypothetical protein